MILHNFWKAGGKNNFLKLMKYFIFSCIAQRLQGRLFESHVNSR